MHYQELKTTPLATLAEIALDVDVNITERIASYEAMSARVSETIHIWSFISNSDRAVICAAYALDANDMARRGFITSN